jgi:hypothetical protein
MDETWHALSREAGLAAEHIASGATALSKANYAQTAYYAQAFFSLSVGFERSCKLGLLLDYAIDNNGEFPREGYIRHHGHNLKLLLNKVSDISVRRQLFFTMPDAPIHRNIIDIISEFANNVTRYYNIDVLTGAGGAVRPDDPIVS